MPLFWGPAPKICDGGGAVPKSCGWPLAAIFGTSGLPEKMELGFTVALLLKFMFIVLEGVKALLELLEPLMTIGEADLPNAGEGVVPKAVCDGWVWPKAGAFELALPEMLKENPLLLFCEAPRKGFATEVVGAVVTVVFLSLVAAPNLKSREGEPALLAAPGKLDKVLLPPARVLGLLKVKLVLFVTGAGLV